MSHIKPSSGKQRVEVIDALRGFAILGILLANILSWSGIKFTPISELKALPSFDIDLLVYHLNGVFVDTKFYTIFSLLFGIGFYLQYNKNRNNQAEFMPVYYRRLGFLMLFGLIHMFFWSGDILFIYALVGFVFVQFRNLSNKAIFNIALISFIAPLFVEIAMLYIAPGYMVPAQKLALKTYIDLTPQEVSEPFKNGSFWDVIQMNFHNLKWRWFDLLPSGRFFKIFAFFLLGFYLMATEYFTKKAYSIGRLAIYLIVGLTFTFLAKSDYVHGSMAHFSSNWNNVLYKFLFSFGQVNLAFAYISILTIAYKTQLGKKLMVGLKYVGRMSFSSYLSHTIFGIIIFYPFAFGYFGKLSLWQVEVLAVVIYAVQVLLAKIWLNYFAFGPLEWLWRSLTYGEVLPIKKKS
ncbi:MAG: DUF418 domain-containing protein [Bacteroidetes bacterium]|nr:MAG: DUF418 domain-containing protein [Bacteroidota bacterium]